MSTTPLPDLQTSVITPEIAKQRVNQFLDGFFRDSIDCSHGLDSNYGDLWRSMHQLSQAGGKRLRPYFLLLAYTAYGGNDVTAMVPIAGAQELLHLSLLIHDDIIDKDFIRYGQDNVSGIMRHKYRRLGAADNADHFGNSAAILAGDLLISGAYQAIVTSVLPDNKKMVALAQLGNAVFLVGGGELLDTESSLLPWGQSQSLKIADFKTARYSFVAPLVTGALMADAGKPDIALLEELGIAAGIAFQLADDLLGIYGDSDITGKSTIGDIREGKRTYMMEQALLRATKADQAILKKQLGNPKLTETQAKKVRDIVEKSGAKADCEAKINLYASQAIGILDSLSMNEAAKTAFRALIQKAAKRVK